nr:MAG TPA: hypothetical protein [Caudoviricetes sp.]
MSNLIQFSNWCLINKFLYKSSTFSRSCWVYTLVIHVVYSVSNRFQCVIVPIINISCNRACEITI